MAPLSQAVNIQYVSNDEGVNTYRGHIDADWTIGAVPQGGYALALIVKACLLQQSLTSHPDIIHITAHYLHATFVGPFEIRVHTLKTGRSFSNLTASLEQQGRTRLTAHSIFGTLSSPLPDSPGPHLTLAPPSPYARRLPLYSHPSTAIATPIPSNWRFHTLTKWAPDPILKEKNEPSSPNRTDGTTVGGGGLEWGAWFGFNDGEEQITTPSLAFLADVFVSPPVLRPKSERGGLGISWFPTMTLAIEFKFPIPSSPDFSKRTVGLYSTGRFINDPYGRHDSCVEVWTSPSNIGEGEIVEGWRDKQLCLAVATQMALTVPIEVSDRQAAINAVATTKL